MRIKGNLALDVFVRRAGAGARVETLLAGDPVHPGDQLRARVRAATRGHFGVFAVDSPPPPAPASAVASYLPAGGGSPPSRSGTLLLLDGAVELDAALGRELLLGVLCPSPGRRKPSPPTSAPRSPPRAAIRIGSTGTAPFGLYGQSLWLRKVAAP